MVAARPELDGDEAIARLRAVLVTYGSVLVTFSGGVDSALVARVAYDVLGDRATALTAVSPTFPAEELHTARKVAEECGFPLLEVEAHELEREGYAANAGDRCYFCKTELFDLAWAWRARLGVDQVADGTLLDDLGDDRPGLRAAAEHQVRHPLVEAGLTKRDVRAAAKALGISVWDKPSFACLGSRFPAGTRVTRDKVERVGRAESALRALGLRQFRVRWHEIGADVLARVEVEVEDLPGLLGPGAREAIVDALRGAGFRWVTIDLAGYRSPERALRAALQGDAP